MLEHDLSSSVLAVVRLAKVIEIVLGQLDLTVNQFRLLTLADEGMPTSQEVSIRLVSKPPNVTVMSNAMVRRGLMVRGRGSTDGRNVALRLTNEGNDLLAQARQRCSAAFRFLAVEFGGQQDVDELFATLEAWIPALDAAADRLHNVAAVAAADKAPLDHRLLQEVADQGASHRAAGRAGQAGS
ncbi:hypothetical protein [Mycobacterium sp. E2479]|uniref:transcriptional regulator, SarA/Rot family n=1 Tax=Mycobacterium sp. E2479 TaxID=1834134 RepID=UPI0007FF5C14|nr:hypothetical protein [Mycobacterium sp. E2479]OBH62486.1 hypothetical protein A5686_19305 [Mycobacterium sp. E2479]